MCTGWGLSETVHHREVSLGARIAALVTPGLLVLAISFIAFESYDQFMLTLDPWSARGVCRGPDGAKPVCDFANHYYPQGRSLMKYP